ncbi:MAG: ribonuclease P protein component [Bacteroidales bacterium]|nr:ribonuclease P protein component [Bacteroidales bacterium]
MPATFTKEERLSSFREIQALMKEGKTLFHYPFKAVYLFPKADITTDTSEAKNAIMVSVPKRNFKRAVKRNLLKRRIREGYRLNKELLEAPQGCKAHLLFVYVSKDIMEYSHIERKMKELMQQISFQWKENEQKGNVEED